jgi:glyoxylate/hydroxypyruvate reductase A
LIPSLTGADLVVLLLPNTPETENVLSQETLSVLKPGAFVLNPGRGSLVDEEALLQALDSGQLAHATLDVFRQEPLPETHAFWAHPKITITPHIAAEIRAVTAAPVLADNIRRAIAGEPLRYLVDRKAGY